MRPWPLPSVLILGVGCLLAGVSLGVILAADSACGDAPGKLDNGAIYCQAQDQTWERLVY